MYFVYSANLLKMKMFVKSISVFMLILVFGCASSSKFSATAEEKEFLNTLIANRSFEINADWASPMATQSLTSVANAGLIPPGSTVTRINITGTASYLRIMGDSVKAQLPYYGERQMGGGIYNQNKTGIQFEGIPRDFSVLSNPKSNGQTMKFTISENGESFDVTAELFPSLSSTITIASSHRTTIWYNGFLSEFVPEGSKEVEK